MRVRYNYLYESKLHHIPECSASALGPDVNRSKGNARRQPSAVSGVEMCNNEKAARFCASGRREEKPSIMLVLNN